MFPPFSVDSSSPAPPPDDGQLVCVKVSALIYTLFAEQATVILGVPEGSSELKSNVIVFRVLPSDPDLATSTVFVTDPIAIVIEPLPELLFVQYETSTELTLLNVVLQVAFAPVYVLVTCTP